MNLPRPEDELLEEGEPGVVLLLVLLVADGHPVPAGRDGVVQVDAVPQQDLPSHIISHCQFSLLVYTKLSTLHKYIETVKY